MKRLADDFLRDTNIPQVSDADRESCEGLITIDEATSCLKQLNNGSSPGCDGITVEFMKVFWIHLRDMVVDSINAAFDIGHMSPSQTKAVITMIHKGKELPRDSLRNWRPISLTNTDYKILAKCLASRMGSVINDIVHEDQKGYIKGRKISTAIRLIDDTVEHLNHTQSPGLLMALDYERAYDSISKEFLLYSLEKFGFGARFVRWVSVLMEGTKSSVN